MQLGIDGRSALVVGGSKGIGFEAARFLAADGARVAVLARTKTDVDAAVETIRGEGGMAIGVTADVSNAEQLTDAVRAVSAAHGPPLIVIGQAKYQRPGDFADIADVNVYRESFELHTMSQIMLLHAVLPAMKEAGWGRFVHIGSGTAKEPAGNIHHVVANTSRPSTSTPAMASPSTPSLPDGSRPRTRWRTWTGIWAPARNGNGATSCSARPACPRPEWANPPRSPRSSHTFAQNLPATSPVVGSRSTVACTVRRSNPRRTCGNPWCA
jgi:nucleoside-diphosphate-sugar epimerase